MVARFIRRYKQTIIYGVALALLLFLLKWLEWRFIIFDHAIEVYSGAIAVLFTGLGIWLALKLARPKISTIIVEKEIYVTRETSLNSGEPAADSGNPDLIHPPLNRSGLNLIHPPLNLSDPSSPLEQSAPSSPLDPSAPSPALNEKELTRLGLSAREREVLQLMAEGLSNQEIAARLFVSPNTIKTHSSKIFEKMDVRRRTQAIDKARRLNIIM